MQKKKKKLSVKIVFPLGLTFFFSVSKEQYSTFYCTQHNVNILEKPKIKFEYKVNNHTNLLLLTSPPKSTIPPS